jgi:hypothetical protein
MMNDCRKRSAMTVVIAQLKMTGRAACESIRRGPSMCSGNSAGGSSGENPTIVEGAWDRDRLVLMCPDKAFHAERLKQTGGYHQGP